MEKELVKTITTDNGSEFASHQLITNGLRMKGKDEVIVYFASSKTLTNFAHKIAFAVRQYTLNTNIVALLLSEIKDI